jgi:hypothetical protein
LLIFATWSGKDPHDADDAVARVMVYIGRHWSTIRDPIAYARRAGTRAILNVRRDRRTRCTANATTSPTWPGGVRTGS